MSYYLPLTRRSVTEKEFYELMNKIVTSDKVLLGVDFIGHVACNVGGSMGSSP